MRSMEIWITTLYIIFMGSSGKRWLAWIYYENKCLIQWLHTFLFKKRQAQAELINFVMSICTSGTRPFLSRCVVIFYIRTGEVQRVAGCSKLEKMMYVHLVKSTLKIFYTPFYLIDFLNTSAVYVVRPDATNGAK